MISRGICRTYSPMSLTLSMKTRSMSARQASRCKNSIAFSNPSYIKIQNDKMSVKPFAPQYMKIGILTAALQELTPRQIRDADPDRAIEDWIAFARELGADNIQLSAALHPSEADVPEEAMLDPVANTLDLREPFNRARAARVLSA